MAKQKQKLLTLKDTRGNFYLGIRLPTQDYKPRPKNDTKSIKSRGKMIHK